MKKAFLCLFFFAGAALAGVGVLGQDTSPVKIKEYSAASNYAGGVDRNKVMDLFQDQQFDEAIGFLSRALQADSDNLPVLNYAGYAYYMNGEEDAAKACYDRMLRIDGNSVMALHYLVVLNETNDARTALSHAQRLITLQPGKAAWWR